MSLNLNPEIWGPNYWFFLNTIAISYPNKPNDVIKKKYYDFIQNFPLFIPDEKISNDFIKLLDKYPVSPYLDTKENFIQWIHFIHNKINNKLNKQSIPINDFFTSYYENYKPKKWRILKDRKIYEKIIYLIIFVLFFSLSIYLYQKY